jgi:hypothetical protein
MLIDVTCFVECPEEIIPSSVRLVGAKDRVNFFRDIPGPSFDLVLEFDGVIGERERGSPQPLAPGTLSKSVSSAVEGTAEVTDGIVGAISARLDGDRALDPEFCNLMVRSMRIRLEKRGAVVTIPKLLEFSVNVSGVFLCARNLSA